MLKNNLTKIKELFQKRKIAYCQTFDLEGPHARRVLQDLAKFCRATETTFASDDRISNVLEGRREVWLRIQNHLQLTPDELYDLHHVKIQGD